MNVVVPLKGYVLQDGSGVLGIVPAGAGSDSGALMAMEYIKKNRVLKTLYADPEEDIIDFIVRVQKEADHYRKTHGPN